MSRVKWPTADRKSNYPIGLSIVIYGAPKWSYSKGEFKVTVVPEMAVIDLASFWIASEPDGPITIWSPTCHPVAESTSIILSPADANDVSLVQVVSGDFP